MRFVGLLLRFDEAGSALEPYPLTQPLRWRTRLSRARGPVLLRQMMWQWTRQTHVPLPEVKATQQPACELSALADL